MQKTKIFSKPESLGAKKREIINLGNVSFMGEISRWLFFFYLVFLRMFVFPEIVNRSNQYVGVYSALVEVSRLVINWPSLTEQTYRTKRVINKKHLILHINWWFFRTAITLQIIVFGSVCQVHPLILRSLPTVSPIGDVLLILLPPSVVFCHTQCSLCSTGRLVFLRFILLIVE